MKLHYSLDAAVVLDEEQGGAVIASLQQAGVHTIWLWGFFFGKLWSPVADMVRAADRLREAGFEVGVIQLPVGHPGNGLNPEDDALDLRLPGHWQYRVDREGREVYYCANIEPNMIADNRQAVEQLAEAGFTAFFMDDDLRMGNWGTAVEGSFGDADLQAFQQAYGYSVSRASLANALDSPGASAMKRDWIAFNCQKVTDFMSSMALPDLTLGLMAMHLGDERHGIDIAAVQARVPGCLLRVGESHFSDQVYEAPEEKADAWFSILFHLDLMGRERAFSETTVFPPRALSQRHLLLKAQIALASGVPNILFMSGTWLITDNYWRLIASRRGELEQLSSLLPDKRTYPIHIAYGTYGYAEALQPAVLPLLAGLPAVPVRSGQAAYHESGEPHILLFFGEQLLTPEWEARLPQYSRIIMDEAAYQYNASRLAGLEGLIERWAPEGADGWNGVDGPGGLSAEISSLRNLLGEHLPFPSVRRGEHVGLIWLEEAHAVIALNLLDAPQTIAVGYGDKEQEMELAGLEVKAISL